MVSIVGLVPRTMDGPFDLSHVVTWPVKVLSSLWSSVILRAVELSESPSTSKLDRSQRELGIRDFGINSRKRWCL